MTIDEMEAGHMYTIRYDRGNGVEEFTGCRFVDIAAWWFEGDPPLEKRAATAYRANTTPSLAVFFEDSIVSIEAE